MAEIRDGERTAGASFTIWDVITLIGGGFVVVGVENTDEGVLSATATTFE